MKIQSKLENVTIEFSDDMIENDNFVGVTMFVEAADGETQTSISCDFELDELMPALIAFDAKRSRRNYKEESV